MPIFHFEERISPRRFRAVDIGFFGDTREQALHLASVFLDRDPSDLRRVRK
jgi:hypothetical protein